MIHLASPLPGANDARGTIDVRTSQRATTIGLHSDLRIQAAKEGCLNIVRQAEKAGIKHIVVISSVAALATLSPGITIKAPLTPNGTCVTPTPRRLRRTHSGAFSFKPYLTPITIRRLV